MNFLELLEPEKEFFIGIDSDGCVFDTMEVKHKEFFCPNTVKYFGLFAISKLSVAWSSSTSTSSQGITASRTVKGDGSARRETEIKVMGLNCLTWSLSGNG